MSKTKPALAMEAKVFAHNFAEYSCQVNCVDDGFPFNQYNATIVGYTNEDSLILVKVAFTYKGFAAYKDLGNNIRFTTVDTKIINKKDRVYTGADVIQIKITVDKNEIKQLIELLEL